MEAKNTSVFLFGVTKYQYLDSRGTINDFRALRHLFAEKYRYNTKILVDREISRQADILTLLDDSDGQVNQNDQIIIYYIGYAVNLLRSGRHLTYLATPISRKGSKKGSLDITQLINHAQMRFPGRKLLFVFDVCSDSFHLSNSILDEHTSVIAITSQTPNCNHRLTHSGHILTVGLIIDFLTESFYLHKDVTAHDLFLYLDRATANYQPTPQLLILGRDGSNFSLNLFRRGQFPSIVTESLQALDSRGAREDGVVRLRQLLIDGDTETQSMARETLIYLSQNDQSSNVRVAALRVLGQLSIGDTFNIEDFMNEPSYKGTSKEYPEFLEIPAGAFIMGSDHPFVPSDESPEHSVYLPKFHIGKTPITNYQYALFVSDTNYRMPNHWQNPMNLFSIIDHPVVNVTWYDCLSYCQWLTTKLLEAGKILSSELIRLPSEAEWEKTARGSNGIIYPWGNDFNVNACNYTKSPTDGITSVYAHMLNISPYGAIDMVGNCWEWTLSLWGTALNKCQFRYPYNPKDGRENITASDGYRRIIRGGGYYYSQECVTGFTRNHFRPKDAHSGGGFRVVWSERVFKNSGFTG